MKKAGKKIFFLGILLLLFAVGFLYGKNYYQPQKSVVLRVSMEQEKIDYDLLAGMNYMQYLFRQNGYKVYETKYPGNFYFNEADNADVNVFVRAYNPFLDIRLKKNAFNICYLHRFTDVHEVEFNGYDYYLSAQHTFINFFDKRRQMTYFQGGAVPHEVLKPNYQYDVLYIYEYYAPEYENIVTQFNKHKLYGGMGFAALSEKERQDELARAKTVVYFSGFFRGDDTNYIPYAAYDIISYGRPLVTNLRASLVQKFGSDVYLFDTADDLGKVLIDALNESDNAREQKAQNARQKLLNTQEKTVFDFIK